MSGIEGKRIVLGVTGGIAAYKSIEVCRRLVDAGAHVIPVLTDAALHMVGPTTFTALASERPKTSLWADVDPIPHTSLGQTCDAIVVCPATARIISDYRAGRSADLLSATLIATEAPVIVCPAMHTEMWEHPAVQENLEVLAGRGVIVVPPEEGRLAGGDIGKGRLAAPEVVVDAVFAALRPADLAGKKVVVSAGGTREAIDPVRFIGNRSTGKQGYAIARAAQQRGATVTLVSSVPTDPPPGVELVPVATAHEMLHAMKEAALEADIVVMAAAVADFRPVTVLPDKIKKSGGVPEIVLERTVDILATLGQDKPAGQVLVGFAAETSDVESNAKEKLARKGADLIIANDVSAPGAGFAHDTNTVSIVSADGVRSLPLMTKMDVAHEVLDAARACSG
jgi:phosphopantothenoylcysteine decarboxylase/phosphopantothenate--cysteine ligase